MINRLDSALGNAKNLDEFLVNPSLIEAHYEAAKNYFGSQNFSRAGYDSILRQLKSINALLPELGDRLWKRNNQSELSFELNIERSVARNIQADAWDVFLECWKSDLKKEFEGYYKAETLPVSEITAVLNKAQAETDEFEKQLQLISGELDRKRRRRLYYRSRRNDPALVRIAALLVYHRIEYNTRSSALLKAGDGDLVLNLVRNWVQYPRTIAHKSIGHLAGPVLTSMRDRIPPLRSLLVQKEIFPRRLLKNKESLFYPSNTLKSGRYFFETLPRNLHGIWYGEPNGDCLATFDKDGEPLAARWGLLAVAGAQAVHIRSETKYFGSLMITPLVCNGKTYGLLEFWSSLFLLKGVLRDGEAGAVVPILQAVLERLKVNKPPDWEGFCICPWVSFDNWAVMRYLISDSSFKPEGIIAMSDNCEIKDNLAVAVAGFSEQNLKAKAFAPGLIFAAAKAVPPNPVIFL